MRRFRTLASYSLEGLTEFLFLDFDQLYGCIISPESYPRGIDVQNIPHGPVYCAIFAGYITLVIT